MGVRTLAAAAGLLAAVLASACSAAAPSVRGFQNPGGATVVAQMRAAPGLTEGMPEGSASYIGASVDGSLIGFLTADGNVKWYRTH